MKDPATIARGSYEAYVRKDRAAIEELIDAEFHFTSPLDNRIDRKTYFERCWPNNEHIARFEFIHVLPRGEKVFVTYEGTNTSGHGFGAALGNSIWPGTRKPCAPRNTIFCRTELSWSHCCATRPSSGMALS